MAQFLSVGNTTRPQAPKSADSVSLPEEVDEVTLLGEKSSPTLIQPEVGRSYRVGESTSRPITLSFDQRAVSFFRTAHLQVDLEQAAILTSDGKQLSLDARAPEVSSPAQKYAVARGEMLSANSEPWQFRVPGMPTGVFGKPYGIEIFGGDGGLGVRFLTADGQPINGENSAQGLDDFQGMRVDAKVFRQNRRATLGQLVTSNPPLETTGPAQLSYTDGSVPKVNFRAPNQKSLNIVTEAFDTLLGKVAKERIQHVDLEQLKRFEAKFQERMNIELQSGGEVDAFAVMANTLDDTEARVALEGIAGKGSDSLSNQELLSDVGQKLLRASPLEIIVIPSDKSAHDCVETEHESMKQQLNRVGRAYFLTRNPFAYRAQTGADDLPSQMLFVGEEVLKSELGVKAVLMHELLHVFEHIYANSEETQKLEGSFQQASEFQSLYGTSRDEYLTTVGEEFLGTHGTDGPAWAKEYHRPVYELLSRLTGTDPASNSNSES